MLQNSNSSSLISISLKRPRECDNGVGDSGSFKEILKKISIRLQKIQEWAQYHIVNIPVDEANEFRKNLWLSLVEIRPLLYILLPNGRSNSLNSAEVWGTGSPRKKFSNFTLALQLYSAIVRLVVKMPEAALHCSITLISLFPILFLSDVRNKSGYRGISLLLLCFQNLYESDTSLCFVLLNALAKWLEKGLICQSNESEVFSINIDSSQPFPDDLNLFSEEDLFSCNIIVSSFAERCCVLQGVCTVFSYFFKSRIRFLFDATVISNCIIVASELLALTSSKSDIAFKFSQGLSYIATATMGALLEDPDNMLLVKFRESCADLLCEGCEQSIFIIHIHGPQILKFCIANLQTKIATLIDSSGKLPVIEHWEIVLLRWLCGYDYGHAASVLSALSSPPLLKQYPDPQDCRWIGPNLAMSVIKDLFPLAIYFTEAVSLDSATRNYGMIDSNPVTATATTNNNNNNNDNNNSSRSSASGDSSTDLCSAEDCAILLVALSHMVLNQLDNFTRNIVVTSAERQWDLPKRLEMFLKSRISVPWFLSDFTTIPSIHCAMISLFSKESISKFMPHALKEAKSTASSTHYLLAEVHKAILLEEPVDYVRSCLNYLNNEFHSQEEFDLILEVIVLLFRHSAVKRQLAIEVLQRVVFSEYLWRDEFHEKTSSTALAILACIEATRALPVIGWKEDIQDIFLYLNIDVKKINSPLPYLPMLYRLGGVLAGSALRLREFISSLDLEIFKPVQWNESSLHANLFARFQENWSNFLKCCDSFFSESDYLLQHVCSFFSFLESGNLKIELYNVPLIYILNSMVQLLLQLSRLYLAARFLGQRRANASLWRATNAMEPSHEKVGQMLLNFYRFIESELPVVFSNSSDKNEQSENLADTTIMDAVAECICLITLISPSVTLVEFVTKQAYSPRRSTLQYGCASLILRRLLLNKGDERLLQPFLHDQNSPLQVSSDADIEFYRLRIDVMDAAFSGSCYTILSLVNGETDTCILNFYSAIQDFPEVCNEANGSQFLCYLYDRYTAVGQYFRLRFIILDAARHLLGFLLWSLEDLCRIGLFFFFSDFMRDLCVEEKIDPTELAQRCLDVLNPLILFDDRYKQYYCNEMNEELKGFLTSACFPSLIAYVLYNRFGDSVQEKMAIFDQIVAFSGVKMVEIPALTHKHISFVILYVLAQEGMMQRNGVEHNEEMFSDIMRSIFSISECRPDHQALENALLNLLDLKLARAMASKYVFDILDSISTHIGIGASIDDSILRQRISETTTNQWLLSISAFVNFLGVHTTVITPKLLPILRQFSKKVILVTTCCRIWFHIISCCPSWYLKEYAPALVVELLTIELDGFVTPDGFALLLKSIICLHGKTDSESFWGSYFEVLRGMSKLITELQSHVSMRQHTPLHERASPGSLKLDQMTDSMLSHTAHIELSDERVKLTNERAAGNTENVIAEFLTVMESKTGIGKEVIVRGLLQYLNSYPPSSASKTDNSDLLYMRLISALLSWTKELPESDVYIALKCIGVIGAVAPRFKGLERGPRENLPSMNSSASILAFSPEEILDWRLLAFKLLNVYCPRALLITIQNLRHDYAAFTTQALLHIFFNAERKEKNIPPIGETHSLSETELLQYSWWSNLDPKTRQLLGAFTTTRFRIFVKNPKAVLNPHFEPNMSYEHWVFLLFCNLCPKCSGTFHEVIYALRNVVKFDSALKNFILPFMVIHILDYGTSADEDELLTEFNTIFDAALNYASKGFSSLPFQPQSKANGFFPTPSASPLSEHVQQIFHILESVEYLSRFFMSVFKKKREIKVHYTRENLLARSKKYRQFLSKVDWKKRACAAFAIGSHVRALRVLEGRRELLPIAKICEHVPLQKIFASLNDRDSSRSIHHLSHPLTPSEAAISYENDREWSFALQNCELVLQKEPDSVLHQFISLRCMQNLGQLHLMSRYADSILKFHSSSGKSHQRFPTLVRSFANEAAWRLGEWHKVIDDDQLPPSLAIPTSKWIQFISNRCCIHDVFKATNRQRGNLMRSLAACAQEGYTQIYPHVATLHGLTDLECSAEIFLEAAKSEGMNSAEARSRAVNSIVKMLSERMQLVSTTLEAQEPLLSLHRVVYNALGLYDKVAETWMEHAKILRAEAFIDAALSAAHQIDLLGLNQQVSYYMFTAQLIHDKHSPEQAIKFAQAHLEKESLPASKSKLLLIITEWMQEIGSYSPLEVIESYQAALALAKSEKAHNSLALFYDKLHQLGDYSYDIHSKKGHNLSNLHHDSREIDAIHSIENYVSKAVEHFGQALLRGSKTVSVSLPRMLTLWLDSTAFLTSIASSQGPNAAKAGQLLENLTRIVRSRVIEPPDTISLSVIVTALPQLISRLEHPSHSVVQTLIETISSLLLTFPQPCLWQVLPVLLGNATSVPIDRSDKRSIIAKDIIDRSSSQSNSFAELVCDAIAIFKALIKLCNYSLKADSKGVRLNEFLFIKEINPILKKESFILPTMKNLFPHRSSDNSLFAYEGSSTFSSFEDQIKVMNSLQCPKRISVVTNEKTTVPFLCKSKDEPRKDIRMMEIASLMNSFFSSDSEGRRRQFSLRLYSIAALNADCAMIEWIDNTATLRTVVTNTYEMDETGISISKVKELHASVVRGELSKINMFKSHIFPLAGPVFHQWFQTEFSDNKQWYEARSIYTQTTALWSIAGHMVGLGDRHGENLMINVKTGELMHVDFACMFDNGETLKVPERVRFRLTQNVVDGMGVLEVDGPFRTACEASLRCQMKNKNALMSIVETLLHDPLKEWSKQSAANPALHSKRLINRVSRRLDGYLDLYTEPRKLDELTLSVEGQVSKLINHSRAIENLSEMYIWWMAWI